MALQPRTGETGMPPTAPPPPPAKKTFSFEKQIAAQWEAIRPKREDFEGVYSTEELDRDWGRSAEKGAAIFAQSATARYEQPEIEKDFEYCLMEALQNLEWFDDEVSVSPGSAFDDHHRGADLILTFEDNGQLFHLSIDATLATDPVKLAEKDEDITRNLELGRLNEVKYFICDADPRIKGKTRMPQIMLNFPRAKAEELKYLLSKGRKLKTQKSAFDKFKEAIVKEINEQIDRNIRFLESLTRKTPGHGLCERAYRKIQQQLEAHQS
jgi:hypothetical protein